MESMDHSALLTEEDHQKRLSSLTNHNTTTTTKSTSLIHQYKQAWNFLLDSTPLISHFFMQALFNVTNIFFLKQYNNTQLVASYGVGLTWLNLTLNCPQIFCGEGMIALGSQAFGSGNMKKFGNILNQGYFLNFLVFLFTFFVFVLNTEFFLLLIGVEQLIAAQAAKYCIYCFPAALSQIAYEPMRFWLYSQKKPQISQRSSMICIPLNVVWCFLFVYLWDLELIGMGIARSFTMISMYFYQKYQVLQTEEIKNRMVEFDFREVKEGFLYYSKVTISTGITGILPWVNLEITMVIVANLLSSVDIATHSIIMNIQPLFLIIPLSAAITMSGFIGNEAGEGNLQAVKQLFEVGFKAIHIIILFFFISSLLLQSIFSDYLCTDDMKGTFSDVYLLVFIGFAFCNAYEQVSKGMILVLNCQGYAFKMYILIMIIGTFPLEVFLSKSMGMGLYGVWVGQCVGSAFVGLSSYYKLQTMDLEGIVKQIYEQHAIQEQVKRTSQEMQSL